MFPALEGLHLATGVDGACAPTVIQQAQPGALLAVCLTSEPVIHGAPLLLVGELRPVGQLPQPSPFLPGLWLDLGSFFFVANGLVPGLLGAGLVAGPAPTQLTYQLPAALSGASLFLQGVAVTPTAANGLFAFSEVRVVDMP
jgi:hypothetical protein